jgi:hypothetical protein
MDVRIFELSVGKNVSVDNTSMSIIPDRNDV